MKDYKKILEGVVDIINNTEKSDIGFANICTYIGENCPELKESDGEKIRKEMITYLSTVEDKELIPYESWIAWLEKQNSNVDNANKEYWRGYREGKQEILDKYAELEKQGEHKPTDKVKVEHLIPQKGMYYTCIKDYYSSDNTHLCVKGNIYKSFFNGYIDDESHLGLSWTNSCTEKYFEPTKDEDWIVCEHDNVIGKPMQYKEFKKKVNQKLIENLKAQGLTPKLRLWSLQDAKDGDILYAKGSYFKEYLFMFSSFTEDNVISTHFGHDVFHGTFDKKLTRLGREEDFMSVTPATKEQRDTLERAMTNAGYRWDKEKLKLEKI